MRLILYGTEADTSELTRMLSSVSELCYRYIQTKNHSDRDSFLMGLSGSPSDCAYFHKKPISPQILSAAFEKCMKQSICEGEIR